jgi:DNA-directed RNA polymerase specialized sigma24 family protein
VIADAELLARVARRDSTALIELERRHRSSLYAQTYGILMDSPSAERVVREVFAQLWFTAERFILRSSLSRWLHMMAKDLARAEIMLRDTQYSRHSTPERRLHEEGAMVHPGVAAARVGGGAESTPGESQDGDSELPRIRYRKGESGGGDGAPRDACTW